MPCAASYFLVLLVAVSSLCASLARANYAVPEQRTARVQFEGRRIERVSYHSLDVKCADGPPCEVDAWLEVPVGTEVLSLPMDVESAELVAGTEAEIAQRTARELTFSEVRAPTMVHIEGHAGRVLEDPWNAMDFRHCFFAARGMSRSLELGPAKEMRVHGFEELEGVTRGHVHVREHIARNLLRSGGPVLFVGYGFGSVGGEGQEASGFVGHLGWEIPARDWLFVGAFAAIESSQFGAYVMAEAVLTGWALGYAAGLGVGVDDVHDIGPRPSARFKIAVQAPVAAVVMHTAVGASHFRLSIGVQFSI